MTKRKLQKQVEYILEEKSDKLNLVSGRLGILINGAQTVEVAGRPGYVWVRLRGSQSELIQAYNSSVSPVYDLPVLVSREENQYVIYGRDVQRYQNWGNSPYLPRHGSQHSFSPEMGMGGDVTWVYSRQFVPALVTPSGTTNSGIVYVYPHVYRNPYTGEWIQIGDAYSPNLLSAKPNNTQARMLLLYWKIGTGLQIVTGTSFLASITGTADVLPYIPTIAGTDKIPLAAVRLVSGTSAITWENIYDMRQFAVTAPPLFEGGFEIWDEGIPQGTGTIFNFVGNGVTASVSGTVINVEVASSGGGGDGVWTSGAGAGSIVSVTGSNQATGIFSISYGDSNIAFGDYSHAAGLFNVAAGESSVVLAGDTNVASGTSSAILAGYSNKVNGDNSAVLAGYINKINGDNSSILGGYINTANGNNSAILAGYINTASGDNSSVVAGNINTAQGENSSAIAGNTNTVVAANSAILAGENNYLSGERSAILAGAGITGTADDTAYVDYLNIRRLANGISVVNLGINASGFIVTGTSASIPDATQISIIDSGNFFTGTTVESALQELGGKTPTASQITITDSLDFFTGTTVESALQELGGKRRFIFASTHGMGDTVPAGATYYAFPYGMNLSSVTRPIPFPGGVIKNLRVRTGGTQPTSGTAVVEIYSGASPSSLTATGVKITVPAGSSGGNDYYNTTNTYTHTNGNWLQFQIKNNATSTSCQFGAMSFELEYS